MERRKKVGKQSGVKVPKTTEDMIQYFGVLHESMSQDIKTMLEWTEIADNRFDRLETKVDGLETKVDGLETKVDGLETKVDRLETKVDRLEVELDAVKETVLIIKDDVEVMKYDLKNKVDRDEFAALERRVAALEKKSVR